MKNIAEIAPVPFAWTRGLVSERAGALMADLFAPASEAQPGECVGIVKRFVAYGRRSITGHKADAMIVMGYDGRPVQLSGAALGTEGRSELARLEQLVAAPGCLAFGALAPHVSGFHAPDAAPRHLELILGPQVHLLRTADWQTDIAVRQSDGQPLAPALAANLRLLAEHPGSPEAVSHRMEVLYAQAGFLMRLLEFDSPVLPAMGPIAA
ncbi:hypothetical protein SAMN05444722_0814 [Rhodovulum sp. ES.010]|uniref:hypothetical protein n=1 Tax=Rhodovulum sp. ES.010 TaxID=1882821 RepID=UPI00092AD702|nr:hypothetical protein [Rhodovulum sp. ES.010]SIO20347.1 hypothetical protein SAMN05444722_0814 [Rhodovulum sp. ES.010]